MQDKNLLFYFLDYNRPPPPPTHSVFCIHYMKLLEWINFFYFAHISYISQCFSEQIFHRLFFLLFVQLFRQWTWLWQVVVYCGVKSRLKLLYHIGYCGHHRLHLRTNKTYLSLSASILDLVFLTFTFKNPHICHIDTVFWHFDLKIHICQVFFLYFT